MKQATSKNNKSTSLSEHLHQRLREGVLICVVGFALFILVALITYEQNDAAWSHTSNEVIVNNAGGPIGAWVADFLLCFFGYFAYCLPLMMGYIGWILFYGQLQKTEINASLLILRTVGFVLTIMAACAIASLELDLLSSSRQFGGLPSSAGGIFGSLISLGLVQVMNHIGALLLLVIIWLVGITLFTGFSWIWLMVFVSAKIVAVYQKFKTFIKDYCAKKYADYIERRAEVSSRSSYFDEDEIDPVEVTPRGHPKLAAKSAPQILGSVQVLPKVPTSRGLSAESSIRSTLLDPADKPRDVAGVVRCQQTLPDLSLLELSQKTPNDGYSEARLLQLSTDVESKLKEFGVVVQVVAVQPGPVVTRFELQLAPGIKASKVSGLARDIARSLLVISVRIVEVIPGKATIGLELPNEHREIVRLREILASVAYQNAVSPLSLALGKDISGHAVVVDLSKMPHLLVAGTTGAGKSVGLNAMLLSLLYKATPEDVRMILIDPKMLELSIYEGIPHLLTPVVTDMKQASSALRWCVAEMERRYRLMAALGVRNLAGFNLKIQEAQQKGQPIADPLWESIMPNAVRPTLEKLPYIVVLVDEFADMIMVVGKKVEELITRIAQKARAAGIHLILATQRPSVDVITGLIKANVPTRIAYQVSSKIDSRTILDQQGAEQLLGNGDMLYLPPGTSVPVRVHGAFVADQEVHAVVDDLKKRGGPNYVGGIVDMSEDGDSGSNGGVMAMEGSGEQDQLYDQAVEFVIETRRASISGVQRRFRIGYNRAARLIEEMERTGVVSAMESNGAREVLSPNSLRD